MGGKRTASRLSFFLGCDWTATSAHPIHLMPRVSSRVKDISLLSMVIDGHVCGLPMAMLKRGTCPRGLRVAFRSPRGHVAQPLRC